MSGNSHTIVFHATQNTMTALTIILMDSIALRGEKSFFRPSAGLSAPRFGMTGFSDICSPTWRTEPPIPASAATNSSGMTADSAMPPNWYSRAVISTSE